jgi:peroxiredoxin Q/BCP
VSADPVSKQKKFCDKQGFPYDLLSDESHTMLENYGVWGKKKFMGREYMGISRITYVIDEDGKIEHVIEKVKTMSHAHDLISLMNL